MTTKHFYIFRHGETNLNQEGRFQGQSFDLPLNENGCLQAMELSKALQPLELEAIVTSPLKRACQTAKIVSQNLNIPLLTDQHFIEGNFGQIEGKTYQELSDQEKDIFIDWIKMDQNFLDICYPQGETKRQILNRALEGLKKLAKLEYQSIGISTHSAVVRLLLLYLGKRMHHIPNAKPFHVIYEDGIFKTADFERILLLSCCAPCSCAVIEKMAKEGKNFSVAFYNPNITPFAEYAKRRDENRRVCEMYHVDFIELEYNHETWLECIHGYENEPERGKRCSLCFHMRLKHVMTYALENGFTAVASVLGVSRYKNLDQVNMAADLASRETGCCYLDIEGRKNGMQEKRAALIRELNLYNQNYCGCKPR